jgi:hypothetical protein
LVVPDNSFFFSIFFSATTYSHLPKTVLNAAIQNVGIPIITNKGNDKRVY